MWQLNCPHIYAQASADTIGATSPHVNVEQIKNFRLALPPPAEQEAISLWISAQLVPIHGAIARAQNEIDLIREYRTRLIADVVTGQLDVRDVSRTLPEIDAPELSVGAVAEDESEELLEAVVDHE
jgi:type I restriction enzyme S subunit